MKNKMNNVTLNTIPVKSVLKVTKKVIRVTRLKLTDYNKLIEAGYTIIFK